MDRGALWGIVLGVAKSSTRLSNEHFHFTACNILLSDTTMVNYFISFSCLYTCHPLNETCPDTYLKLQPVYQHPPHPWTSPLHLQAFLPCFNFYSTCHLLIYHIIYMYVVDFCLAYNPPRQGFFTFLFHDVSQALRTGTGFNKWSNNKVIHILVWCPLKWKFFCYIITYHLAQKKIMLTW